MSKFSSYFSYPYLQFNSFVVPKDGFHFKVDAHRADKSRRETIVGITEQKRRFSYGTVADNQQLKHVVEVLIGSIFLPLWISSGHLKPKVNSITSDSIICETQKMKLIKF